MHFDFSISLGDVLHILTILAIGGGLFIRIDRLLIEHEILVEDYCERKHLKKLPTRGATSVV